MSQPRTTPPFRADHVGSLIRPPDLRDAHTQLNQGKLPREKKITADDFTFTRAVLGLISTKLAGLEPKDAVKRRIDEAARHIDLDRLCLSPQCGFASSDQTDRFTISDQERKLAHLVEIAREVWG